MAFVSVLFQKIEILFKSKTLAGIAVEAMVGYDEYFLHTILF
jgi:hypothetical protein